jgi:hypothetical protein
MRTVNTQRYDIWDDEVPTNNIIYLRERYAYNRRRPRTRSRRRQNTGRSDMFWNIVFTVLCLSVLVCLFLH